MPPLGLVRSWACSGCGEDFFEGGVLRHLREVHAGAVQLFHWTCAHCPFAAEDFEILASHCLRLKHSAEGAKVSVQEDGVQRALAALTELLASQASLVPPVKAEAEEEAPSPAKRRATSPPNSSALEDPADQSVMEVYEGRSRSRRRRQSSGAARQDAVRSGFRFYFPNDTGTDEEASQVADDSLIDDEAEEVNATDDPARRALERTSTKEPKVERKPRVLAGDARERDNARRREARRLSGEIKGHPPPRFTLLHPSEGSVVPLDGVLELRVTLEELRRVFVTSESGLKWLASLGLIKNSVRCDRTVDGRRVCDSLMSLLRMTNPKRTPSEEQKRAPANRFKPNARRARDDSHGKCVDGFVWKCKECRRVAKRTTSRAIRAATIFTNSHYSFREIILQLYAWSEDLDPSETEGERVGDPAGLAYYDRNWVRAVRDIAAEWCLAMIPSQVKAELDVSVSAKDKVDFFALFRKSQPPGTVFPRIVNLIRAHQEKKFPDAYKD